MGKISLWLMCFLILLSSVMAVSNNHDSLNLDCSVADDSGISTFSYSTIIGSSGLNFTPLNYDWDDDALSEIFFIWNNGNISVYENDFSEKFYYELGYIPVAHSSLVDKNGEIFVFGLFDNAGTKTFLTLQYNSSGSFDIKDSHAVGGSNDFGKTVYCGDDYCVGVYDDKAFIFEDVLSLENNFNFSVGNIFTEGYGTGGWLWGDEYRVADYDWDGTDEFIAIIENGSTVNKNLITVFNPNTGSAELNFSVCGMSKALSIEDLDVKYSYGVGKNYIYHINSDVRSYQDFVVACPRWTESDSYDTGTEDGSIEAFDGANGSLKFLKRIAYTTGGNLNPDKVGTFIMAGSDLNGGFTLDYILDAGACFVSSAGAGNYGSGCGLFMNNGSLITSKYWTPFANTINPKEIGLADVNNLYDTTWENYEIILIQNNTYKAFQFNGSNYVDGLKICSGADNIVIEDFDTDGRNDFICYLKGNETVNITTGVYSNYPSVITLIYFDTGSPVCYDTNVTFSVDYVDVETDKAQIRIDGYGNGSFTDWGDFSYNPVQDFHYGMIGTFQTVIELRDTSHTEGDSETISFKVTLADCNDKGEGGGNSTVAFNIESDFNEYGINTSLFSISETDIDGYDSTSFDWEGTGCNEWTYFRGICPTWVWIETGLENLWDYIWIKFVLLLTFLLVVAVVVLIMRSGR